MSDFFKNVKFVSAVALTAVAALACGWMIDGWRESLTWLSRLAIIFGYVATVTAVLYYLNRDALRREHILRRYIELLCHLEETNSDSGDTQRLLPDVPAGDPLGEPLTRLRQLVEAHTSEVQKLERARARADVKLRTIGAERTQIQEILASLSDPVIAVDRFDELTMVNPSAERLFELGGLPNEERTLARLSQCEALVELLSETRRRKAPAQRSAEIELGDDESGHHCYQVTVRSLVEDEAIQDEQSQHGAVIVLRDVSTQKAIQKRNAEFVSAVSHEMKTPLAGIRAYVEMLADGEAEDEETREEFFGIINSQTERLQRLIDNLLNLSRIEAGVVNVSKKPRSINELMDEAVNVVRHSAEDKNITLTVDLSSMYLSVLVDHDMLLQAAINLLSNAIKYTKPGGEVTLRSRMKNNEVQFEVEDTGVGLSEEDSQKVFEKFYRVKKNSDMAQGTGLGLPLAKHIVEDVHGGRLTLESKLGKGSIFRVTLPSAGNLAKVATA